MPRLAKEQIKRGVGYASGMVAVLTLASRLIGLLRVRIFASQFGAGEVLDTYYAAFRIPDFIMGVLIVGTLSIAALPVIVQYLLKSREEASRLVANLINFTFIGLAIVCSVAALLAPWLVRIITPGFTGNAAENVVELTRIILLAQVILAVSNVLNTSLNATKRFFWAGVAPIMYNAGLILGVVVLYPLFGIHGLGYGVVVGALLHILVQVPSWLYAGFSFRPILDFGQGIRKICRLYIPRLFTIDLSQVSLLLASFFGSFLASGSIAVFVLGFDLQAMPVGVFAFAVATAAFPHLANYYAEQRLAPFIELLFTSIVRILFYMLPITVVMLLLRAQIVRIIYGAGNFTWDDTRATLGVLGVLAFSLIGQSLVPLLSRALLARHSTWAPVLANIGAIGVTAGISVLLAPYFGIHGVAAGYSIGVTCNALLLYIWLRSQLRRSEYGAEEVMAQQEQRFTIAIGKLMLAVFLFSATVYGLLYAFAPLLDTRTWFGLVLQSAISLTGGGLVYITAAQALRLSDAHSLIGLLLRVFGRMKIIARR